MDASPKYSIITVILLIVVTCAAFGRIIGNDFINLDDTVYVTENSYVQSGLSKDSVKWAVTTADLGYWHPLTLISHMLDWNFFGAAAAGHHAVSGLLHIGSVIFLFLFLYKTTNSLWPSAFAAALFALHPLRVESVAWVGERKDVLSMFFGTASIYAYTFYAEKSVVSRYLLCLILFALSLISKPTFVTLPFALLLLDYWPLGRWQKAAQKKGKGINSTTGLILEKVLLLCLSVISAILAVWMQDKSRLLIPLASLPFSSRVANTVVSYAAYLGKTFWPVNLAVFYPYEQSLPVWEVLVSGIILTGITMAVLNSIRKLPFLFVGWFWYLGTFVPVIGLVQISTFAMADRYTYLPSIGIAVMLAWGTFSLINNQELRRKILLAAGTAVLLVLSVLTWRQCGYWKNAVTLHSHALQVAKDNDFTRNGLCNALIKEGKLQEAIYHCNEAIRMDAKYELPYDNRGTAYFKLGQYQSAIESFSKAISLKPDSAEAFNNRGNCYNELGRFQSAVEDYSEAIRLKPDYFRAYCNRGNANVKLGQYQRALEDFDKTIIYKPDFADAYNNRALVYLNLRNLKSGCSDAMKSCELGDCKLLEAARAKGDCR